MDWYSTYIYRDCFHNCIHWQSADIRSRIDNHCFGILLDCCWLCYRYQKAENHQ